MASRLLERAFYWKLADKADFERIGLRYINQIPLAKLPVKLETIITTSPPLKGPIDRELGAFHQRYELHYDKPAGILIHQTGIQKLSDGKDNLILDLDFVSHEVAALRTNGQVEKWLVKAHDNIYEAFRASIHPPLFEKMKRGKM